MLRQDKEGKILNVARSLLHCMAPSPHELSAAEEFSNIWKPREYWLVDLGESKGIDDHVRYSLCLILF